MRALIPLLLLGLLSACGQKGSLYFAPQPASKAAPASAQAPSKQNDDQTPKKEQPDAPAAEQD
ncbi:MAG: lipoprotein [Alcanivorax sp.]|nr:lipoprotein [Alcanivorax sp.]